MCLPACEANLTGPYGATPSSGEESELEHDAALDEANLHLDPSNGKAVQRNAVLNDQQETASQTTFNSGALGVQVTDNVFSETKCELARGLDGSVSSNDEHSPGRDLPLFPLRVWDALAILPLGHKHEGGAAIYGPDKEKGEGRQAGKFVPPRRGRVWMASKTYQEEAGKDGADCGYEEETAVKLTLERRHAGEYVGEYFCAKVINGYHSGVEAIDEAGPDLSISMASFYRRHILCF
ncbi:hypothetical protein CSUB01_09328 [Colletotrichum sublineola]|uniref:Uncharacterized protein n=1 Tax=Colletotrichum sublineola TaxID=1173701 RepID=A0A066XU41_COLSU|nr:hypothetical protein CSUB01_09328 [Colletotrichum sublineola]